MNCNAETIRENTVINSLSRTIKYSTTNGSQTLEQILQVSEQEVNVTECKNVESSLVNDDEVKEVRLLQKFTFATELQPGEMY